MRIRLYLSAAVLMIFCVARADAQLYFAQQGSPGRLFTINTVTGQSTFIADGTGVTSNTNGLSESGTPGVLFGSSPFNLHRINTDGSGFTSVAPLAVEAMAYDPINDVLYGGVNGNFYTINQATAATTALNQPGEDVEGLAWSPGGAGGFIYGVGSATNNLLRFDISSGTWSTVGATGVDFDNTGLAYDALAGVLYAVGDIASDNLFAINTSTGVATPIGALNLSAGPDQGGLAFVGPIPEPSGLLFAGLAGVAVAAWRRGRRGVVVASPMQGPGPGGEVPAAGTSPAAHCGIYSCCARGVAFPADGNGLHREEPRTQ